jgi:hypothetical protein
MANDQGPDPTIPYSNPVDRFAQLPVHTRELLEALDKEDCIAVIEIIKSYQRAAAIGWFFKWLVTFMVGAFVAMVGLGESVRKAFEWFAGK